MPQAGNPVPVPFPMGGIDENGPYAGDPGAMAVRADHLLNVRPFDSIERRLRGGQRTGIDKYFPDAVNGSNAIDGMKAVVEAFDPLAVVPDTQIFYEDFNLIGAAGRLATLDSANWDDTSGPASTNYAGVTPAAATKQLQVVLLSGTYYVTTESTTTKQGALVLNVTQGTTFVLRGYVVIRVANGATPLGTAAGVSEAAALLWRVDDAVGSHFYVALEATATLSTYFVTVKKVTAGVGITTLATSANFVLPGSGDYSDPFLFEVRVNGDFIEPRINGTPVTAITNGGTDFASQTRIGFGARGATSFDVTFWQDYEVLTAIQPASLRTTKIVIVSGGDVFSANKDLGVQASTGGTGAMVNSGRVAIVQAFQKAYLCDGFSANYNVLDLATNTVSAWTPTAGALPTGTVNTALGCRFSVLYRGRVGLSGLAEEPNNYFFSASGDALDWDYAPPVTSATQAFAAPNSDAGELGDIVTSMMPFQDDLLFMGGDHTLWVMRGDPAAGGQIDNISRQIGVVGPDAWTWDTGSTLYFIGQNGLYRMAPNSSAPDLLSSKRMDRIFANIDTATNAIKLMYDREWQGVHIFITPQQTPVDPTDHYFWDERTATFWRDQYPTNFGPTAIELYDADDPNDRAVLLGCRDSFVRFFTDSVTSDDGTAIDSYARFPLFHPKLPQGQFQMDDLQMALDGSGAGVTLDLYRGNTPELAAKSVTPAFTKTLVPGRNLPIRYRLRANALQFRVGNNALDETWAYEDGAVLIAGVGRMRAVL